MNTQANNNITPLLAAHINNLQGTAINKIIGIALLEGVLNDLQRQISILRPDMEVQLVLFEPAAYDEDISKANNERNTAKARILATSNDPKTSIVLLPDHTFGTAAWCHYGTSPLKEKGFIVCGFRGLGIALEAPHNMDNSVPGMFNLMSQYITVNKIAGDYLEFGVFTGCTLSVAYHLFEYYKSLKFFAFDSFRGIIGSEDGDDWQDGGCFSNIETFYHNMKVAGVDMQRVTPVMGDFLEIFTEPLALQNKLGIKKCAVAHIDCDAYKPAKAALDFITNLLVQGSILLFDDFNCNDASGGFGERKALIEWLEENPHIQVERWHDYSVFARSYIVHISPQKAL